MGRYQYSIRVEGIGDQTASKATDKRTRICWDRDFFDTPSTADADALYVSGLLKWPTELSFGVNFKDFTTSSGSATYELRRTTDTVSAFLPATPGVVANVTTTVDADDVTLILDTGGLSGVLYLGREAVNISSGGGGGGPTYSYTVQRAVLATNAENHSADASEDNEVFASMHPTTLSGRVVELVRADLDATDYTTEQVLWTGVLNEVDLAHAGVITLSVDDVMTLIRETLIYTEPFQIEARPITNISLFGNQHLVQGRIPDGATVVTPDAGAGSSLKFLASVGEGVFIIEYKENSSSEMDEFVRSTMFMGQQETVKDLPILLREVYSTNGQAPSNSASPAENTLPLRQHPGELCLQLLLTTRNNGIVGKNDATFDTGINNLAGGVPASLIDNESFLEWGDKFEPMDCWHLGIKDAAPVQLGDALDSILRPRGAALVQTASGILGVADLSDALACGSSNAIVQDQILNTSTLSQHRNLSATMDQTTLTYNSIPGRNPSIFNGVDSIRYARAGRGRHDRLSLGDIGSTSRIEAARLTTKIIQFFHNPIWSYDLDVLSSGDFWPGDVVAVTHDKLVSAGAVGVTAQVCLVVERRQRLDADSHMISLTVWNVSEDFDAVGCISQCGRVSSWDVGTGTFTLFANAFTHATRGVFSSDAASFAAADVIELLDSNGASRDANIVVGSVSGNDLVGCTGVGVTPVQGDIVQAAEYTLVGSAQKALWTWIADPDGSLNGDDGQEYTT